MREKSTQLNVKLMISAKTMRQKIREKYSNEDMRYKQRKFEHIVREKKKYMKRNVVKGELKRDHEIIKQKHI